MVIQLSEKWSKRLLEEPETGMGYQIVSVILRNGKKYDQVIVDSGYITRVHGFREIPFNEEEIEQMIVTHEKWNFNKE